jgi:hypothetical protein
MGGVNDDLKIVVKLLTDVPTELGGDNPLGVRVEAADAKIDFVLGVEDTDFGMLGWGLPLIGLSL